MTLYNVMANNKLAQRFAELEAQLKEVQGTKRLEHSAYIGSNEQVDRNLKLGWEVKAKHLLEAACGPSSQHLKHFGEAAEGSMYLTSSDVLDKLAAIFLAAKEDFDGGYLTSVRSLVQAEVFDSELEQASELLEKGYATAAAVIAGTVLETTLRELCGRNGVAVGTMDRMNADLTKKGVYNANMAKRVISMAAIRNSAAHGRTEEFKGGDVKSMIDDIGRLLSEQLQ